MHNVKITKISFLKEKKIWLLEVITNNLVEKSKKKT